MPQNITLSKLRSFIAFPILVLCQISEHFPDRFLLCKHRDHIWCQCDIIYSAFILWGLYRLFQKDSRGCMIFVGIAFAFKQQTLFILPFLVILWLKVRIFQRSPGVGSGLVNIDQQQFF